MTLFILSLLFLFHLTPLPFRLGPKISGRDLLLVEESCNAPDSMRQVSASYSLSLPCHLLACCILPCHHLHVFQNLHPFGFSRFSPLSVRSPDHSRAPVTPSQTLFRVWVLNFLGMARGLPSGLGIAPVDRLSSFVPFGGRLILQRLTG